MTIGPLSSTGTAVQFIQDMQTADYVAMSAAIMFIWDYGGLTDHILYRMARLLFGSLSTQ